MGLRSSVGPGESLVVRRTGQWDYFYGRTKFSGHIMPEPFYGETGFSDHIMPDSFYGKTEMI